MTRLNDLLKDAQAMADPELAQFQLGFFKTKPGEYGAGDTFMGLKVPQTRQIARKFRELSLEETWELLQNRNHELRLIALHILEDRFGRLKKPGERKALVDGYLGHLDYVNNWDLVDTSAYKILGQWLVDKKDRSILYQLAKTKDLWRQRVAMIATLWLIKKGQFDDTLTLAELFLDNKHDLMHKAAGWMLREMGKQDLAPLRAFLDKHASVMPRTMLRYAIEKLSPEERTHYMQRPHDARRKPAGRDL